MASSPASVPGSQRGEKPGTKGPHPLNSAPRAKAMVDSPRPAAPPACPVVLNRPVNLPASQATPLGALAPSCPPPPQASLARRLCNASCVSLGPSHPSIITASLPVPILSPQRGQSFLPALHPAGSPCPPSQRNIAALLPQCPLPFCASPVPTLKSKLSPLTIWPRLPPAWEGGNNGNCH